MSVVLRAAAVSLVVVLSACSSPGDPDAAPRSQSPSPSTTTPTPTDTASSSPQPVPATYFGTHDHDPVATWPEAPFGSVRAWDAGVTWRELEPAPGQFDFSRLDALVDNAEQHGSDVLLVLGQTPVFHALDPASESFYGEGASSPPEMAAWKAYVRAVAEHYAGRPVVLQVWNEANVAGFWSGTPQQMADLTKAAYDVLADVTPRPQLVAPALVTRLIGQRAWVRDFYGTSVAGKPVADYVDAVSLQLYPEADGTPESSLELLAALRTVLEADGVAKPIWNTEINYGLTGTEVDPADEDEQISNVVATYLLNAANGVQRVYWYGWDQQSIVDTLLTEPDLTTPTPAGRAYRTVHEWLLGGTVQSCAQDARGTWTCEIDHPDGHRTVWWNPRRTVQVTVPDGTTETQEAGARKSPAEPGAAIEVGAVPIAALGAP